MLNAHLDNLLHCLKNIPWGWWGWRWGGRRTWGRGGRGGRWRGGGRGGGGGAGASVDVLAVTVDDREVVEHQQNWKHRIGPPRLVWGLALTVVQRQEVVERQGVLRVRVQAGLVQHQGASLQARPHNNIEYYRLIHYDYDPVEITIVTRSQSFIVFIC